MKTLRDQIETIAGHLIGHGYNDHAFGKKEVDAECKAYTKEQVDQLFTLIDTAVQSAMGYEILIEEIKPDKQTEDFIHGYSQAKQEIRDAWAKMKGEA